jgi:hypothetical protein
VGGGYDGVCEEPVRLAERWNVGAGGKRRGHEIDLVALCVAATGLELAETPTFGALKKRHHDGEWWTGGGSEPVPRESRSGLLVRSGGAEGLTKIWGRTCAGPASQKYCVGALVIFLEAAGSS